MFAVLQKLPINNSIYIFKKEGGFEFILFALTIKTHLEFEVNIRITCNPSGLQSQFFRIEVSLPVRCT